jgi:hypothetical protein
MDAIHHHKATLYHHLSLTSWWTGLPGRPSAQQHLQAIGTRHGKSKGQYKTAGTKINHIAGKANNNMPPMSETA